MASVRPGARAAAHRCAAAAAEDGGEATLLLREEGRRRATGEESRCDTVAGEALEAQPIPGQISPAKAVRRGARRRPGKKFDW